MTLRLVHLSDIHFGQEKDGSWEPHDDVRNELLLDLQRVRQELVGGSASAFIVTGDIAQSGREEEYKTASAWLEEALSKAGAERTAVMAVPGNHDVDLAKLKPEDNIVQTSLRNAEFNQVEQVIASIAGRPEHPIMQKFVDYRSFAFAYGTDFSSWSYPVTIETFTINGQKIRFFGLCTAMLSDRNDTEGSLFLSGRQYRIPRQPDIVDVVFMHHPPSWLRNRDEVEEYLNSRARILLTGHEHQPVIDKMTHPHNREQLRLSAGATNPPYADEVFRYSYSWLELDWIDDGDGGILRARSFPRTWCAQRTTFVADHSLTQGEEMVQNDIKCSVRVSETKTEGEDGHSPSHDLQSSTELLQIDTTDNITKDFVDSARLDTLRLFFWRKLQKNERIELLISLDLLSPRALDRVPSAVERRAFEEAKEMGCLHKLWAGVMEKASPADRLDNPFGADE